MNRFKGLRQAVESVGGRLLRFVVRNGKVMAVVAVAGGIVLINTGVAHATGSSLPDIGVDVSTTTTDFGTTIGGYLLDILGLGVIVIAIMFAWKKYRRIA